MPLTLSRRTVLAGLWSSAFAASCSAPSPTPFDAQVIVVGAGLSGLFTARILAAEGYDVLVMEASDRIGGRLYTISHEGGLRTEAGGQEVGAGYARMRSVAGELGVGIVPAGAGGRPQMALHYQGSLLSMQQWPLAPTNAMPPPMKAIAPGSVMGGLAFRQNPFNAVDDWRNPGSADISAYHWLKAQGLSDQVIADADISLNANDLKSYSMANLFRSLTLFKQDATLGKSGYVAGGSQRLPEAMALDLQRSVLMGERVEAITAEADCVYVETQNKRYKAERCVAAVPFPVLANMQLEAPLSDVQRAAITGLPYTKILQIHFTVDDAYWERDGFAPSMWTDGMLERVFADQDSKTGKPNGMMRAWINGTHAAALDKMTDAQLAAMCAEEMKRLRPAMKGGINVRAIARWTDTNTLAGGAYMHWAPGQIGQWAGKMGTPAGRLHFAGEHLSHLHTGMEGAMESGENTAFNILSL